MTDMKPSESHRDVGHVLVVDDEPRNRELLRDLLVSKGYRVTEAGDGVGAIEKAGSGDCDAILLDVMMPRMNGIEACLSLKQDPATAHIPVLMVTALSEKEQRHAGIAAGANDYLVKPIDRQDVILRVRNAVRAKHLYDRVQMELARVTEQEALRQNLTNFIAHDMRSPLMVILGGLQIMAERSQASDEGKRYLDMALGATGELVEMVSSMLDVSRLESRQMPLRREPCDLAALAGSVVRRIAPLAASHKVKIGVTGNASEVSADSGLIERVFVNLLHNAIRFSPAGGEIVVHVSPEDDLVRVAVRDAGPGIPPEYRDRIFEKFGQVDNHRDHKKYSTGLGLAFCKLAVEAHGGWIGVESEVGEGSTFWFALPVRDRDQSSVISHQ